MYSTGWCFVSTIIPYWYCLWGKFKPHEFFFFTIKTFSIRSLGFHGLIIKFCLRYCVIKTSFHSLMNNFTLFTKLTLHVTFSQFVVTKTPDITVYNNNKFFSKSIRGLFHIVYIRRKSDYHKGFLIVRN